MENFIYARSFRDLLVYKRVFIGSRRIFDLAKGFPKEESIDTEDPHARLVTTGYWLAITDY